MFEDYCNVWLRNGARGAGLRCRSGLGLTLKPTNFKDTSGAFTKVDVELDRDPRKVHGWQKDWLPFGDVKQHLRPQIYYGVPVALVNQLIRANGGTN